MSGDSLVSPLLHDTTCRNSTLCNAMPYSRTLRGAWIEKESNNRCVKIRTTKPIDTAQRLPHSPTYLRLCSAL